MEIGRIAQIQIPEQEQPEAELEMGMGMGMGVMVWGLAAVSLLQVQKQVMMHHLRFYYFCA